MNNLRNIRFTVESGSETWDHDVPYGTPPIRHIDDYWVMFGKQIVKKFAYKSQADEYAKKMNKAIKNIK